MSPMTAVTKPKEISPRPRMSPMKAPAQGTNTIVIEAPRERIWELLANSQRLIEWAPMVNTTTGEKESLGAVRHCDVEFNGKPGKVTERCSDFEPTKHIGWVMEQDSFGFVKMLDGLGFDFRLESIGPDTTRVINTTYYRPRNILASLMNVLMIKRNFRKVRQTALGNLKWIVEGNGDRKYE